MARIATPLLVATVLVCLIVIVLDAKDVSCGRKCSKPIKKYEPTDDLKLSSGIASKKNRSPRQTFNEQRQYYPCMTCFQLGGREVCTNPYCPSDDFQCDKASKRCHKKARVGANRPAAPAPEEAPADEV